MAGIMSFLVLGRMVMNIKNAHFVNIRAHPCTSPHRLRHHACLSVPSMTLLLAKQVRKSEKKNKRYMLDARLRVGGQWCLILAASSAT